MEEHIKNNIRNTNYKPHSGFQDFESQIDNFEKLSDDDKNKYKKAYKHMYYRIKI